MHLQLHLDYLQHLAAVHAEKLGFGMSAISRVLKGAVEPPDDMA